MKINVNYEATNSRAIFFKSPLGNYVRTTWFDIISGFLQKDKI